MSDVRLGYKRTDIGIIPEEWESREVRSFSKVVRGGSPRPAGDPRYFDGDFKPWVTVASLTNIPDCQVWVKSTEAFLTEAGVRYSRELVAGTPIIANSGATLGIAKLLGMDCCANDGVAALLDVDSNVEPLFMVYFFNSITRWLRETVATGNGQPNLNTDRIGRIKVPLPKKKSEQLVIAKTLQAVDELIASLEALIAKKRDISQGAMQELLTGYRRLRGFQGKWSPLNLAKSSHLRARIGWQGLTTAEYLESGEYLLVTGTDFLSGRVNWDSCHFVDRERYLQDRNIQLQQNDILLTKDGTIGKVGYVDSLPGPATLNSGVFVVRPKPNAYCSMFGYFILSSAIFSNFLNRLQAGSTINHLYQKDFVTFEFLAPPITEQREIAAVLSDMDTEIANLHRKLAKTRALKQGMTKMLLTGEVRLA